jgi:hypothetical protein
MFHTNVSMDHHHMQQYHHHMDTTAKFALMDSIEVLTTPVLHLSQMLLQLAAMSTQKQLPMQPMLLLMIANAQAITTWMKQILLLEYALNAPHPLLDLQPALQKDTLAHQLTTEMMLQLLVSLSQHMLMLDVQSIWKHVLWILAMPSMPLAAPLIMHSIHWPRDANHVNQPTIVPSLRTNTQVEFMTILNVDQSHTLLPAQVLNLKSMASVLQSTNAHSTTMFQLSTSQVVNMDADAMM